MGHRRGFTLIELMLVLSVGSMISLLSFQGMKRDTESHQARIVGQQMLTIGQATDTYIANRYGQISQLSNAAGGAGDPGPRTCSGTTCTITVQTLVNEGLLPVTYQNLNSFGSGYTISMNVTGIAPNWSVTGVVTTDRPWAVGGVTRYDLLGQAMAAAGADSGMSRSSAARIDGYGGVWTAPVTLGPALGLLGFRVGSGTDLYAIYLRRDGTLPMTGDLNMSDGTSHSIDNVDDVTGTGRFTSSQTYTSYLNLSGNLDMSGTATVQGNVNVAGNASVAQNMTVGGNAQVAGDLGATGTVTGGYLVPKNLATQGSACSVPGEIAQSSDHSGTPLFCKGGTWQTPGSSRMCTTIVACGQAVSACATTMADGTMMEYGTIPLTTQALCNFAFPTAFPNSVLSLTATVDADFDLNFPPVVGAEALSNGAGRISLVWSTNGVYSFGPPVSNERNTVSWLAIGN